MAAKFVFVCIIFYLGLIQVTLTADWYTARDGHQYLIETAASNNWLQAMGQCSRRGLQLVVINNEIKNNALVDLIKSNFGTLHDFWIGHHDEFNTKNDTDRSWYSVATGEPITYSNWNSGEPNNYNGPEHCTELKSNTNYKWNDEPCDAISVGFICEEHYKTTQCQNDIQRKRYSTNEKNTQLDSDFLETQKNIQAYHAQERNDTDILLLNWEKASEDVFGIFKKSLNDFLKKKPYLQAVIADIGEEINAIATEAKNEIAKLTQQTHESIEIVQLNGERSVNNETSGFAEKIKIHNNEVDSIFY
ncbi:lectin subunit alpha-like [Musca autumnalis]|uniref:lectin subunit alpha-like n=1 Tax=Musca autumnalis TaxID=221902 RepID=UPI003CEACB9E